MKLRLALVGYGNAANLHLPGYQQLGPERCEVVAVCGHSRERAQAYAEKHGIVEKPLSGATLARDVSILLYAAYVSAEEGRRMHL